MLLAVACVGWLLFFIHHISRAISVNHIVDRIAAETDAMIDEMMPWPHRPERMAGPTASVHDWETTVAQRTSGYIRFVDAGAWSNLAKSYHVKIKVLRRVGHFVPAGVPLLTVSKEAAPHGRGPARTCAARSTSAPPARCSRMWSSASCRSSTLH